MRITAIAFTSFTAFLVMSFATDCAYAQRTATSIQRRVDKLNRQNEDYEREQLSEDLKTPSGKPADRKPSRKLAMEVEKDFKQLQEGYNTIVLVMAAKTPLIYPSVSEAINEIAKCSVRLKQNLALPNQNDRAEKGQEAEPASGKIEEELMTLRNHIYSFVTNPLFESHGVLNIEQAKAASGDLDKIIVLSKTIKRNGDRAKN